MPAIGQKIRIWPGHFRGRIWPNRIWPGLAFQSSDRIWPNRIWPELVFLVFWLCVLCLQDFLWVSSRFLVCVFKIWGPLLWTPSPLRRSAPSPRPPPSAGRPHARPPSARPPKISLFFFLSPAGNFILSFSLWGVFSLNFGGVRSAGALTFGLSGCRVNSKRVHLSFPALQTPPKFNENPQREKKE